MITKWTWGDYFAGAGGWSIGAVAAGAEVVVAVNHNQIAVNSHAANHPQTRHFCANLRTFDHSQATYDGLVASPSCVGHTRARGKERMGHDEARATAWCVTDAAENVRMRNLVVENVPEFRAWELYPEWLATLHKLGYQTQEHILDAADFGVPQHRVRYILTAKLGAKPVRIEPPMAPHSPASSFLEWDAGAWQPVEKAGRAESTLEKIRNGRRQFGRSPFLIAFFGNSKEGRSIDRPIGTLTTHDRYGLVRGDEMRMLSVKEAKAAMTFPADYVLAGNRAEQMKQLGNAVCPMKAQSILAQVMG